MKTWKELTRLLWVFPLLPIIVFAIVAENIGRILTEVCEEICGYLDKRILHLD